MSLHRTKATLIGLFEAGRANEWVVTEKLGDTLKNKAAADAAKNKSNSKVPKIRLRCKFGDRLNPQSYLNLRSLFNSTIL